MQDRIAKDDGFFERRRGAQYVFFCREALVLVGRRDFGAGDLVSFEAQQVELALALAVVAAERRDLLVELGKRPPQGAHLLEVDPGEAVEGSALDRRAQKRLVRVLTVQVDEVAPARFERCDRRHLVVDLGARPSRPGHDAPQHDLAIQGEASLDGRLGRGRADDDRIGAPADEQLERLDHEGLAGAGLTGDRRQSGRKDDVDVLDHPELADAQLLEHV